MSIGKLKDLEHFLVTGRLGYFWNEGESRVMLDLVKSRGTE